jgi:uncharacterized protein
METRLQDLLNQMYTVLAQICPHPLSPEGMHGVLSAVAISPRQAVPNTWIPVLYNMKGEMPEFANRDQAKGFLDTCVLAYNAVVASLSSDTFSFTFSIGKEPGEKEAGKLQSWCEGFIRGLRITGVDSADFDEDFINLMSPIAFCARPDFFSATQESEDSPARLGRIAAEMPENLIALRNYFYISLQRKAISREAIKAGRNDPCPCGSGKKFKHCCGKTAGDA